MVVVLSRLKRSTKLDLKKKIKAFKNTSVKVGFPKESSETNSERDGVTALEKATANNFGVGVPKRPFMSIAFRKNEREYKRLIQSHMAKIEKIDYIKFLNQLGLKAQGDIQKAIIDLQSPPNAQSTVEAKGSSSPLIDTGHMMQSASYFIESKK